MRSLAHHHVLAGYGRAVGWRGWRAAQFDDVHYAFGSRHTHAHLTLVASMRRSEREPGLGWSRLVSRIVYSA